MLRLVVASLFVLTLGTVETMAQSGQPLVLPSAPNQQPASQPDEEAGTPVPSPDEGRAVIPNYLRRSGSRAGGPANDLNPSGRPEAPPLPGGSVAGLSAAAHSITAIIVDTVIAGPAFLRPPRWTRPTPWARCGSASTARAPATRCARSARTARSRSPTSPGSSRST